MKSILIIDDEKDILETFSDYFSLKGYLTYTAVNTQQAREKLTNNPDIIILDVAMPDEDGFTFCQQIRQSVSVPIIFLSAKIDEESKLKGLMAGGDDYLTKPVSLKELETRVAAHLRREQRRTKASDKAYFGDLIINYDSQVATYLQSDIPLTKTEFTILAILSKSPQIVFTKEHLYEQLWGWDKMGDPKIISEHIRRIRTKISKATGSEFIQTVWGVGYKWIG